MKKKCLNCSYEFSFLEYIKNLLSLKQEFICPNCKTKFVFSIQRRFLVALLIAIFVIFYNTLCNFFYNIGIGKKPFTIVYFNLGLYVAFLFEKIKIKE